MVTFSYLNVCTEQVGLDLTKLHFLDAYDNEEVSKEVGAVCNKMIFIIVSGKWCMLGIIGSEI